MKGYWQSLNQREQMALVIGGAAVGIYLLYLIIFAPLFNTISQKSLEYTDKQQTLRWMEQVRGHKLSDNTQATVTNTQLLSLLAKELKRPEFQSFPYQLQQVDSGDIQLSFEQVPFNSFIKWFKQLSTNYSFDLKQFKADRAESTGVVKLTLVLSASPRKH